jgi:hypothetical protein
MNYNELTFDELDEMSVQNLVFGTKELSSILKAHLFVERLIDSLIENKLTNPASFFKNQISFSLKLDIAHSLGIIPDRMLSTIKSLNGIRNKYAHDLNYQVTLGELNALKLDWEPIQKEAFDGAKEKGIEEAVSITCIFICWSILHLREKKQPTIIE